MNYITTITTVIDAVKAIEALMPSSTGKDKLDAVLTTISNTVGLIESQIPAITSLIGAIVSILNAAGIFKKSV